MERHDLRVADVNASGDRLRLALKRHPLLVQWKTIKARPVLRGEGFEAIHRVLFIEDLRVALKRMRRTENTCATARGLFGADSVRR